VRYMTWVRITVMVSKGSDYSEMKANVIIYKNMPTDTWISAYDEISVVFIQVTGVMQNQAITHQAEEPVELSSSAGS